MIVDEIRESLRKTGRYETSPDVPRSIIDRVFGNTWGWYYHYVLKIVMEANRMARRGLFTNEVWCEKGLSLIRAMERCGGKTVITGTENIAGLTGGRVYISNHMSVAETFSLPAILLLYGPVATVIKTSLLHYPIFGAVMRSTDPIVVRRANAREDLKEVLTTGQRFLEKGRSVMLFPNATRHVEFDAGSFNSLGAKLAAKAGVPLVPIALTTDYHGIGRHLRDCGPVDMSRVSRFNIGEPIKVDINGRAAHEESIRFIVSSLREWGISVVEKNARNEKGQNET